VYSDTEENGTTKKVIDIDQVSHLGESAPTSLYRDRRVNDKKAKVKAKPSRSSIRRTGTSRDTSAMDVDFQGTGVKPEPISPDKINRDLPEQRDDDTMLPEDEIQDRDDRGRRVRMFARTGGNDDDGEDEDDEVNEAQKVDLSESEEEEEEESMEGDFVQAEGEVSLRPLDHGKIISNILICAIALGRARGEDVLVPIPTPVP
jgi:DNA-directed RNA polymerase III subunit RPC4